MMDRAELLGRLAKAKARADKANLDIVMLGQIAATAQVGDACIHVRLKDAQNTEQKHIAEVTWLLDQLDKLER